MLILNSKFMESTDLILEQDNEEYNDNPPDHTIGHSYEFFNMNPVI